VKNPAPHKARHRAPHRARHTAPNNTAHKTARTTFCLRASCARHKAWSVKVLRRSGKVGVGCGALRKVVFRHCAGPARDQDGAPGRTLGVPGLRQAFPNLLRAELTDLLARYRRVWRQRNREPLRVLHWHAPGRVWAIDFTGPLPPVEGHYPYLLAVRDLASGAQLLWLPVEEATAAVAADALAALFKTHGAPLVLKSDNGPPFIAEDVRKLAHEFAVEMLFSPAYTPEYNGAIEAGIGSLKNRTEASAARHGRPGFWTLDDVAAAQLEANATARPQGPSGPTPDQAWANRQLITPEERTLFRAEVERQHKEVERQHKEVDAQGRPEANLETDLHKRA